MPHTSWEQYGIAGVVIGVLFFLLWRMLTWVMVFIKDTVRQHNDERINWLYALNKQGEAIGKIIESINHHDERANERGKFVRDEHKKMIDNLEEQYKVLLRINGHKDEN